MRSISTGSRVEVAVGRRRHQLAVGQREARRRQRRRRLPPRSPAGPARRARSPAPARGSAAPRRARSGSRCFMKRSTPSCAAVARVAHAGADDRLQVEGQPFLGAAGDVVQVEAHGPEEVPGAADGAASCSVSSPPPGCAADQLGHASACRRRSGRASRGSAGRAARRALPSHAARPGRGCRRSGRGARRARRAWRRGSRPAPASLHAARKRCWKAVEQRRVARQMSAHPPARSGSSRPRAPSVRQSSIDARGVADLQPEIPEQVQHELDQRSVRGAGSRVGQEQQVDVANGASTPRP